MNLTGHRSAQGIARHLILGALAIGQLLPTPSQLVDLGSGAGFPGLPLALLWPRTRVVLVEARQRRHHFQREAIRRLQLDRVEAILGRAEAVPPRPSPMAIAQAMAPPSQALLALRRWATPGGLLVLPLGEAPPDLVVPQGVVHRETRIYQLPLGGGRRTLWLGEYSGALDSASPSV